MAILTTSADVALYIKKRLGWPVTNVELADSQLRDIMDDSADIMRRYLYGEANYSTYLSFSVTSGTDEYSLSGNDVLDVFDFQYQSSTNGINSLFSPDNMILSDSWVMMGQYPGGSNCGNNSIGPLTEYEVQMQNLEQVRRMFTTEYRVDFWPGSETLKITPTPTENLTGILMVYKKETIVNLYNHIHFKNLCTAKSKILWGTILGKVTMQLPGGGNWNGDAIKSDGKEELEKVMSDIWDESEPLGFEVG